MEGYSPEAILPIARTMGYEELSGHLWRQRAVLEMLVFKLEEEHLLLASGRHAWLSHSTAEVSHVIEALEAVESARAVALAEVAADLGLAPGATLREIASAAPEPWDRILDGHREALLANLRNAQRIAALDREVLALDLASTNDALAVLGSGGTTYEADGSALVDTGGLRLLDRAL